LGAGFKEVKSPSSLLAQHGSALSLIVPPNCLISRNGLVPFSPVLLILYRLYHYGDGAFGMQSGISELPVSLAYMASGP
jgi:hypothetical protein